MSIQNFFCFGDNIVPKRTEPWFLPTILSLVNWNYKASLIAKHGNNRMVLYVH